MQYEIFIKTFYETLQKVAFSLWVITQGKTLLWQASSLLDKSIFQCYAMKTTIYTKMLPAGAGVFYDKF